MTGVARLRQIAPHAGLYRPNGPRLGSVTSRMSAGPHVHAVTFYDHDREVVDRVARFVADGIRQHGRAIVIATPEHRVDLAAALLDMGLNPDEPPVAGHLVTLDAQATLDSLMTEDGPDLERFSAQVAQLVRDAGADGAQVRVFGEMVGLLWESGDVPHAIALESLWNDLIDEVDFALLCAYSSSIIDTGGLTDILGVCDQHSSVQAPPHYAIEGGDHSGQSRVFLPVPEAVVSSRRFVISALERLGRASLVHDAALIISELATNAVQHARSPFRVSVDESGGTVCLSVQDVGQGHAQQRVGDRDQHAIDGRGMAIIAALARRWGCDTLEDGKVVWAELAA